MTRDVYQEPTSDLTSPDEQALRYAELWIRTAASIVDTVLILLIIVPLFALIYGTDFWTTGTTSSGGSGGSVASGVVGILLNYILPPVAVIAFWVYRSATPGKILCKLKLISTKDGGKPSVKQLIGRYLAYYLSMITVLPWLYMGRIR